MAHFLTFVLLEPDQPDLLETADSRMRVFFASDMAENPNAKCDGFVIGGRFDGYIIGKEQHYNLSPAEYQKRYGLDVIQHSDNICIVSDIPNDVSPGAVVTADGQWHDCFRANARAWKAEWKKIRTSFPSHIAVAFDCHC
ncbi:MAG: hypothetical protein AAGB04_24200 [Pseudomonadota bacterium]